MKLRLISKSGENLKLLDTLATEGVECDLCILDTHNAKIYNGPYPLVRDWKEGLYKKTYVVLDSCGSGPIADLLIDSDFRVFSGGRLNDRLELDREFALKLAKSHGMRTTEKQGISLTIGGIYRAGELIPNTLHSVCCDSIYRFWKKKVPKIYKLTLKKFEPFLQRFGYNGLLVIDCVIAEDKFPSFGGFVTRFDNRLIQAAMTAFGVSAGDYIRCVTDGEDFEAGVRQENYDVINNQYDTLAQWKYL